MVGSAGNDTFDARTTFGAGSDHAQLIGGNGNDTYILYPWMLIGEAYSGGIDTAAIFSGSFVLPAGVENLSVLAQYDTFTNPVGFELYGNELNNAITGSNAVAGGAGQDFIDGGLGADAMIGGSGADLYKVDNSGDRVVEDANASPDDAFDAVEASVSHVLGANVEILRLLEAAAAVAGTGNASDNRIEGNAFGNTLRGLGGGDYLLGGAGNDVLEGGNGNDRLQGDAGTDKLDGGNGDDEFFLTLDDAADVVVEAANGGEDSVSTALNSYVLTPNVENLFFTGMGVFSGTGNASANRIEGGDGNDTLAGLAGDDVLVGGAGSDGLVGGAGNDTYHAQAGDVLVENANEGADWVFMTVVIDDGDPGNDYYALPDNFENLHILPVAGFGSFGGDAYGNALNNIIRGNQFDNRLEGRGGNDTLEGFGGNDLYAGGAGNDVYVIDSFGGVAVVFERAGEGDDTVRVRGNLNLLWANVENVIQTGSDSGATYHMQGNGLGNRMEGSAGKDVFEPDAGNDILIGRGGDDFYHVQQAGDIVMEARNEGIDTIQSDVGIVALAANVENLILSPYAGSVDGTGNALNNVIKGNDGINTLNGAAGNDELLGGGGNDVLRGGAGNDILAGGAGIDLLDGGAGNDAYHADGGDVISDSAGLDRIFLLSAPGIFGTYTMAAGIEDLEAVGLGVRGINGNALNNFIAGNAMANTIAGGAGNDAIDGRGGADTMIGGLGNDTYHVDHAQDAIVELAGEGTDQAIASMGNQPGMGFVYALPENVENLTLAEGGAVSEGEGNALANLLTGNAVANVLVGYGGADSLAGGAGDDSLDGSSMPGPGASGIDILRGGAGNDVYSVDFTGAAPDLVLENANEGTDDVAVIREYDSTVNLSYTLPANVESVVVDDVDEVTPSRVLGVSGNAQDNFIVTGIGRQVIAGSAGNDTLVGNAGNDEMNGGAGNDIFYVDSGDGAGNATTGTNEDKVVEAANGGTDTVILVADVPAYMLDANVENLVVGGARQLETEDLIGFNYDYGGVTTAGGTFSGNALANRIHVETAAAVTILALGGDDAVARVDTLLAVGDSFAGGAGRDTLSIALENFSGSASASGFEVLNLRNTGSAVSTWSGVGAADSTSTAMTVNIGGNGTAAVEADLLLGNLPANLLLPGSRINISGYDDDNPMAVASLELGFGAAASGGADALNIGLSGSDVEIALADVETVNLISEGGLNIAGVSGISTGARLNISGTQALELLDLHGGSVIGVDDFSGGFIHLAASAPGSGVTVKVGAVTSAIEIDPNIVSLTVEETLASPDPATGTGFTGESFIDIRGEGAGTTLRPVLAEGGTLRMTGVDAGTVDLNGVDGVLYLSTVDAGHSITFDAGAFAHEQTSWRAVIINTGEETDVFNFTDILPRYTFIFDSAGGSDILNANITGADPAPGFDGSEASGKPGAPHVFGIETINFFVDSGSTSTLDGSYMNADRLTVSTSGPGSPDPTVVTLSGLNAGVFDATSFNAGIDGGVKASFSAIGSAFGSNGDDELLSAAGSADIIHGGLGNDLIAGGGGEDRFRFSESGAHNFDTIVDFESGRDGIELHAAVFTALDSGMSDNFVEGTQATAAGQYLIFDAATGSLYYDADANGDGVQQQIANLGPGASLVAGDIFLFTPA